MVRYNVHLDIGPTIRQCTHYASNLLHIPGSCRRTSRLARPFRQPFGGIHFDPLLDKVCTLFCSLVLTNGICRFWHRLVLSGYSDFANLFLAILPSFLTRNVKTRKVMTTFLLFLMSGLVHNLTSWQLNSSCRDYADLQFFCLNALGVILESFLAQLSTSSRLFRQERHETGRSSVLHSLRAAVARLLGYVWVTTFFVWAVPRLYYQRLHCIIIQK